MSEEIALMAHLMRRGGFGATRGELERYASQGYEATVEWLLNPGDPGDFAEDVAKRRASGFDEGGGAFDLWATRMVHSNNPLEEKMTLFLHGLFPVQYMSQGRALLNQVDSFRRHAFGSFRDLIAALSRDPAMLLFLNNNDNHRDAMNENYGRELIELFSMGVGNYNETDVKQCARAFTGWTLGNADYMAVRAGKNSFDPYGSISWHFEYKPEQHDDGVKTFLGETGRFNGQDICDIIVKQPSTARFVCTQLFRFFVADTIDDGGRDTIDEMVETYYKSGYEVRSILRTLFNSAYFKSDRTRFARVKGPVELVIGAVRMTAASRTPASGPAGANGAAGTMGQGLFRPPSVEGWHEGKEWIESGALVQRVNYVSNLFRDPGKPGVKDIIDRVASSNGRVHSPETIVDLCIDYIGPITVSEESRAQLVEYAATGGDFDLRDREDGAADARVGEVLGLIAATPEYQFA